MQHVCPLLGFGSQFCVNPEGTASSSGSSSSVLSQVAIATPTSSFFTGGFAPSSRAPAQPHQESPPGDNGALARSSPFALERLGRTLVRSAASCPARYG